jgi:hypothetical protein
MNSAIRLCAAALALPIALAAQSYDVSIQKASNYNSWGAAWDSVVVLKNNITTLAIVPKIGGRIMQYDIAGHASMYVDSANKGNVPAVSSLLGGFRTLASPQSNFTWPPSPVLEVGIYSCAIKTNTADSGVVYLESGIENTSGYPTLDGLQFKRTVTLYKSSSHVKVDLTMVNKGTATLSHGIWDITECVCRNNNVPDTSNIWLYFPLNPTSTMGGGKGYAQLQGTDASQWKPNVAPGGVMGVVYHRKEAKVGADSKAGWLCYVDRLGGYAYVKKFVFQAGKTYPDSGSSVEVYTSGTTTFLEEEVMGPMTTLAPGDSATMTEHWFAARSLGPVLAVNDAGIITNKLTAQQSRDSLKLQGTYGIFYLGTAKAIFTNATGVAVAAADSFAVSPSDSFVFKDTLLVPAKAAKLMLSLYGADGSFIGNLDSIAVTPVGTIETSGATCRALQGITVGLQGRAVSIDVASKGNYSLNIITLSGKQAASVSGKGPGRSLLNAAALPRGVYCVEGRSLETIVSKKIFLP